jgi:hypothetical protein
VASILAASIANNASTIIIACLMLGGAIFVLCMGFWYYRRWLRRANGSAPTPWTFDEIRKMRDQGQLSEAEYQALRTSMIGQYTGKEATTDRLPYPRPSEESWDWVADQEPGAGGFDVKKETPG